MANKDNIGKESARKQILDRFPRDERNGIKEIWKLGDQSGGVPPAITDHEIEDALSGVHQRLGLSEENFVRRQSAWKLYLAAASILLIFGAGLMLIPKTVHVPAGQIAVHELPDGSVIEMNSGTRVQYSRFFPYINRTVEMNGEAYFSVSRGNHPFLVHANGSTVEVSGTRFNVRSWSGDPGRETEVTVSQGEVRFFPTRSPGKPVVLTPGSLSRWNANLEKPSDPERVSIDRVMGWRENMLIFNNKPLSVIFNELERKFDVQIDLQDPRVGRETLTTFYAEPQSIDSVLSDICMVKGLRFAETRNGFRVYKN